jgi:hypothetical protein
LSAILLVLAAVVTLAAPAGADDLGDEWQFVTLINQARANAGLPALGVLGELRDIARAQSIRMAQQNLLYHTTDLVPQVAAAYPDWQRLGENVGQGGSVDGLHQAFMNSPGHQANILGDYNYMAIGVVHANGYTWVTEEFVKATPGKETLSPPAAPALAPPIPVIRIAGLTTSDTWLAVSSQFPSGQSDGVVVGRSDVFADALAGGPLAAILRRRDSRPDRRGQARPSSGRQGGDPGWTRSDLARD